jgi:hypothetical protein
MFCVVCLLLVAGCLLYSSGHLAVPCWCVPPWLPISVYSEVYFTWDSISKIAVGRGVSVLCGVVGVSVVYVLCVTVFQFALFRSVSISLALSFH